ncbi:hypothetical protein AXF42_Ash014710 [Apostasia shenzhenica]|uniref:HMA domain-containing protein n=1 Tax=Apostasia shenzhenica TaxID=1088818 RepID=A0A2H9ZW57_9ASPA|nr:hypothetical protein AXF42_Ash014710 [Apostasia shenzhenica]
MGKIVRMPCARVAPAEVDKAPKATVKPTSFFSEGMGGLFMKWTYSTDVKGYRKVMIGGVQLDCEGCPKKVRHTISQTEGVLQIKTDMENEIVVVMGKNMSMTELKKNVRMASKTAEILDILPWKIKY